MGATPGAVPGKGEVVFTMDPFIEAVGTQWTKVKALQEAMTKDAAKGLDIGAMMNLQQQMNILEMAANLGSTMMSAANGMVQQINRNLSK